MKTIYLIKSLLPLIFLPIAPSVVQVELQRHGLATSGGAAIFIVILQIIFTFGIIGWIAHTVTRSTAKKAFLRMSCVSKKVFHQGRWMTVESYLAEFHNIVVSHGMTPEESTEWIRESEQYLRQQAIELEIHDDHLRDDEAEMEVAEVREECLTH